jgi:hypothetical protein
VTTTRPSVGRTRARSAQRAPRTLRAIALGPENKRRTRTGHERSASRWRVWPADAARERIEQSGDGADPTAGRRPPRLRDLGVLATVEPRRAIEVSLTGLETRRRSAPPRCSRISTRTWRAYCALTDRCETEGLQAASRRDPRPRAGTARLPAVPLVVIRSINAAVSSEGAGYGRGTRAG